MKKIIITIAVLIAVFAAGILNGTEFGTDEVKNVRLEEAYKNQFPAPLPEVIFTAYNFVL